MGTFLLFEPNCGNSTMSYEDRVALHLCGAGVSLAILQLDCGTENAGETPAPQECLLELRDAF